MKKNKLRKKIKKTRKEKKINYEKKKQKNMKRKKLIKKGVDDIYKILLKSKKLFFNKIFIL
jgi:hypothetical protein